MKITVSDLGAITRAEIDLKPLTLLVGRNNTGKTWLAYTLAGALGTYGWRRYLDAYISGKTPEKYRKLDTLTKQITENSEGTLDLVQFVDEQGEKILNGLLSHTRTWMRRFLSTDRVRFDTLQIQLEFASIKDALLKYVQDIPIESRLGQDEISAPLRVLKEAGERKIFFYPGQNISERLPTRVVKNFVAGIIFQNILEFFYPEIHFFPTDRAEIIYKQFFFSSLTERSLSDRERQLTRDEIEDFLPRVRPPAYPIGSFTSMIGSLYAQASVADREEEVNEEPTVARYMHLANVLQSDILEGILDFSTPSPAPGREILFTPSVPKPEKAVEMEVSITSSMVRELSALVLYLRYMAEPGELLVIDEPEMNLHPAAQVKIIEFLAMLVNAGLRVLITTHSTYVVDHLINLMRAATYKKQDEIADKFLLESKDAFIAQNNVSVYLVEDGEAKNILEEDGHIDWGTFSEVTQYVQRVHFEV